MRVRPGAFLPADVWDGLSGEQRHRVAMDALAATSRVRPIFAVESAAALHGIPVVGGWPAVPRVAVGTRPPRRPRVASSVRWEAVPDADVVAVDGLRATSPARTAIALAAERGLESGVVAIDHVIRRHGVTLHELLEEVAARRPFRGVARVDAALRLATGCAESALESLSLVRIHQLGFPAPQQQVEFTIDGVLYRVDFFWPTLGVIGEADGRSKYDAAAAQVIWNEKLREDALRSTARGFVRWNWDDAWAAAPLARKLERAGLRADPRNASKYAYRMGAHDA